MNEASKVLVVGAGGPAAGLVIPDLVKRGVVVRGFVHKSEEELLAQTF